MIKDIAITILVIYGTVITSILLSQKAYSILNDEEGLRDAIEWAIPEWREDSLSDILGDWNKHHPNCPLKWSDNIKADGKAIFSEYNNK